MPADPEPALLTLPRIGVDIVPLARIPALLTSESGPAIHRMVTDEELAQSRPGPDGVPDPAALAGRLAAKEAVFKLLGSTGQPLPWPGIQILRGAGGRPFVRLSGRAATLARGAGLGPVDISISHDGDYAIAVAAAVARPTALPDEPNPERNPMSSTSAASATSTGIDKVRDWILGRHENRTELAPDVNIIENRLVDSLSFVELVYTIEDASGTEIDFDAIDIEDFQSLDTIEKAFFS
ncbi:4'-phosphopantetheinyl transferase superfamily protein [Streptomyces sp. NPDC052095]|uniref:4'-phosphopantetheinyl transferase superfamily protein n=1 Tax=unclassified Streptomyces TaxID=2593676 RepID=UPI00344F4292